jgi:glucan phosphoethanolaminetransferase (alkaline phosphatase superfamily)
MEGMLTSWLLVFGYVICVPLTFIVWGPLFRKTQGRVQIVFWFSLLISIMVAILYITTPKYLAPIACLAGLLVIAGALGFCASVFGWHLGPKSKRFFEKVAGVWFKLLDIFLNT